MRKYHSEKRNRDNSGLGSANEAFRSADAAWSRPMMLIWRTPPPAAGAKLGQDHGVHCSLRERGYTRDEDIAEHDGEGRCTCLDPDGGLVPPSLNDIRRTAHPQPGLDLPLQGTFAVDQQSLKLLRFSTFPKLA